MIRGIRGATTVERDDEPLILAASEALLQEMISKNDIDPKRVASLFFSVTADLRAAFPSKVMRKFTDWKFVPIMNMQEIPVAGSLPHCIRVMIHVDTDREQESIKHVYRNGAVSLRPDLNQMEQEL
ncbi:chorismate mutase [Heyndrickxia acidiproducens]|uniref:chorismate mutase n=1 Tax=Heyndrickxia acidiproducens TaxID=1121084 RepID=UPI000368846A|nr:chorismate mutase [Heyndrickxia acidiproducens]